MNWNWLLVIGGAVLILIEIALGGFAGFDLVLIGSAFVIGGGLGMALGSPIAGYVLSAVLCVTYIVVGRKWVRRRLHTRETASNTDALVGQRGLVTERVGRHAAGQVKVDGQLWRATPAAGAGDTIEAGTEVTVTGVNGVTVEVK
jgi:membrane protein implicated in regulation of membrane protease activity